MKSKERFQFKRGTLTKDIITQNVSSNIKSTVKENILMDLNLNLLGGEVGEFYLSPKMICEWFSGTGDSKDLKSIQA